MKSSSTTGHEPPQQDPKNYLTYQELAQRIGYEVQTLRNFVSKGTFKLGKHYFRPNGKVLFYWPVIERWIRGEE